MACASCSTASGGKPGGCNGNCGGGCNKMNTHDWLASYDIQEINAFDVLEVSFKNGARKDFFHTNASLQVYTGDSVLVEIAGGGGYDIGNVSLSGELVRMQIKKKGLRDDALFLNVIRKTNERDVERLNHYRSLEIDMLMHSRAISRSLGLDMKVGEVEMQGDGRKATFLYTADGRVDFRELIRAYNKEFKVKIEMRQIGARQEAARIGGVGSCGRELCCSTWLSDFKSISTAAARYQQLAINQVKLSGMCGRLKCCLNYELDAYLDALESFPPNPERIFTKSGRAELIKTDVFRALMTYYISDGTDKGKFFTLAISDVREALEQNKRSIQPNSLKDIQYVPMIQKMYDKDGFEEEPEAEYDAEELVGSVELPDDKFKKKKKKKPLGNNPNPNLNQNSGGLREVSFGQNQNNNPRRFSNERPPNPNQNLNRNNNQPPRTPNSDEPINPALIDAGRPQHNKQNPNLNRNNNQPPRIPNSDEPINPALIDASRPQHNKQNPNQHRNNNQPPRNNNPNEPINPALIDNSQSRRPNPPIPKNTERVTDSEENINPDATSSDREGTKKDFQKKPFYKKRK